MNRIESPSIKCHWKPKTEKKIKTLIKKKEGKFLLYNIHRMLTSQYSGNNRIWNWYFAINIVIIDLGKKLIIGCKLVEENLFPPLIAD